MLIKISEVEKMSLHPKPVPPIPQDTARVACAAFPKGNIYLQLRDTLDTIYVDEDFADLFSGKGQPAQSPWRLALICIEPIWYLCDRQSLQHQPDKTKINLSSGMIKTSFKIFY